MKLLPPHYQAPALAALFFFWSIPAAPAQTAARPENQKSPAPAAPAVPSPPGPGALPAPENSAPASASAPQPSPAPPPAPNPPIEPPRLFDGGVPAEAAEFRGTIQGCVETVGRHQASFRVKITSAVPDATSKAPKPSSLISSVVLVIQGADKGADGKWTAKPGHHEWVAALKPGSFVVLPVRYTKAANGFRMAALPEPPKAPGACDATSAPAPRPQAPKPPVSAPKPPAPGRAEP